MIESKRESAYFAGGCIKTYANFREATCFRCGKRGHLATICRSREEHTSERQVSRFLNQRKIHQIEDQEEEEEESVQRMVFMRTYDYRVKYATNDPPYVIKVRVEDTLMTFEIDTGSCLTLISEKDFKRYLPDVQVKEAGIIVKTYDGTVVPILGEIDVKVDFRGTIAKLRAVVVRGERKALLGREWINVLKIGNYFVNQMPLEDTLAELLSEHQVVFGETTDPIKGFTFAVNIQDVNPIFHKARPVPFAIRTAVNEVLERMVEKDYLYQVPSSKWATPVVVVPKKNKEFRICCDFKVTLNRFLDTAAYPLPTQQDLFSVLARGKYFSKLDLSNAYLQLEVNPSTQPLLTINTHKGLFRFKRMPFGLANAPSFFQSVMDRILAGINGVICYIDDVLVSTASVEEHIAVLKTIFVRLQKHNIKLKREKCEFLRREIQYLGHFIKEDGIRPLDDKIQGLQKAKSPTNVSELIFSGIVLVPYDATLPLSLATDASQIGVGAVLSHVIEGQEKPIMFASRTLSGAERNYSQIEREALAMIYGVTKFHQFIYGRRFTLITDHKPLVSILGPRAGIPTLSTSRLQRWGLTLAAYTYEIKFRRTQDHGNADLLSRLPVESNEKPVLNQTFILSYVEDLPVTAAEIGVETKKDEVLSVVKRYTQQGWPERVGEHLRPYFQRKLELTMDGECLLWGMRVIIPSSLRKNMLSCLHETHSGMGKMKAVARSHFWWPNLDNQIECIVNGCKNCQQTQTGPSKVKWRPWVWATRPWQRIHIDFAFKDGVNLLIVVDSHSKWVEAIPMREITARKTIEQLRRLFSAYGLPEEVVSDNGPQFTGVEMKSRKKWSQANSDSSIPSTEVRERQARQMRYDRGKGQEEFEVDDQVWCKNFRGVGWIPGRIVGRKGSRVYTVLINGQVKTYHRDQIRRRWSSGESGDEAREKREEEDDPIWMAPELADRITKTKDTKRRKLDSPDRSEKVQRWKSKPNSPTMRPGYLFPNKRTFEEEETSPPQGTSADPLTQIADALSKLLVARSPREIDVSPYDGTFEAQSFFDNFDSQADRAELTYTDRLRKLPCYLQGKPLQYFRNLRLDRLFYIDVRQTLIDLFPTATEASFLRFLAIKLTPQMPLEDYYQNKTVMGMKLNLPADILIDSLTEGLPVADQRLIATVQPNTIKEWFDLVSRIRRTQCATSAAFQRQVDKAPHPTYHNPPPRHNNQRSSHVTYQVAPPPSPCKYCNAMHWHSQCEQRFQQDRTSQVYSARPRTQPLYQNLVPGPRSNLGALFPKSKLQAETTLQAPRAAQRYSIRILASGSRTYSRNLLAFVTLDSQYEFCRLPYGFKNSPQIYHCAINQVMQKYKLNFVTHYFDDFIIFSDTLEDHLQHLQQFLKVCQHENIKLNYNKCSFFKTNIDFLGYTVTAGTYAPQTRNLDTISAIKPPTNQKTLQSFLGAVNVYNKFIPDYARLRAPLNKLLKKDVKWNWDPDCQQAFTTLKDSLTSKPVLHLYQVGLLCRLYCDASTQGIAGILKQVHPDGQVHPVQYFSRALRAHERNYTVSELECLAIVESVDKFRIYLTGIKFTIYTDHQALQWLKTIKNPSGRLFRWSLRLSTYNYEIHYLKGSQQYEADLLSRNPFVGFVSADIIKQHQPTASPFSIDTNGLHTITRKGVIKIIIPETLQHTLMNKVHQEYNHPGISQMTRIITAQYYWKGISKSIEKFVKSCHTCQIIKRPKGKPYGALGQIPPPQQPFDLISIDTIAGFSKYGYSKTYLHVIVDHLTRYAWTFPLKSTSTLTSKKTHLNPYPEINIAREIANSRTQNKHKKDKETFDKQHRTPHFEVNDLVLVKNYRHPDTGKLALYFTGPYKIIEIMSPNVVRIDRPNQPLNRDSDTIHVNKLKYYTENVLYITPPQPRFAQNPQRLSQDIAEACRYLHLEKHIVHMDIDRANVLIKHGVVKLVGFTYAEPLDPRARIRPSRVPESFKPPEMISVERVGTEVDCWRLGIILCEMLDGPCAFEDENEFINY
ncbi:K02A2.6-like, partial [Cordylochernes scorpioides]